MTSMSFVPLLDIVFLASIALIGLVYVLYPILLFMLRPFFRSSHRSRSREGGAVLPTMSVVVPTFNEAQVVEAKIENLLNATYPRNLLEILVVDSGSTDGTREIVRAHEKNGIVLLEQTRRMGKADAVNLALERATGKIVVMTDANKFFEGDSILKLSRYFDDDKVGGVCAQVTVERGSSLWERYFHKIHEIYKTSESSIDSVFFIAGQLFAFRKALVPKIDENAVADDAEIAMKVRKDKYFVRYASDVAVVERVPQSSREKRIQKVRRSFGVLRAMKKNMHFLFNPSYGAYGLLIFPINLVRMTICPFLVFVAAAGILSRLMWILYPTAAANIVPMAAIVICVAVSCVFRRVRSFGGVLLSFAYSFLSTQVFIVLALVDLLRGKEHRVWEKVTSARELNHQLDQIKS